MTTTHIRPDVRLRTKLFLLTLFFGALALLGSASLAAIIAADNLGPGAAVLAVGLMVALNALWIVPTLLLVAPYYRSLHYEIEDDEVIVRAGVITKSVKHVPYRTVTNLKVSRGPLDRLFGIGTLSIQTAGMSGQQGAEESLIGLTDSQAVYDLVVAELRRFRTAMPPTQAGGEPAPAGDDSSAALLEELRAIRVLLERERGS